MGVSCDRERFRRRAETFEVFLGGRLLVLQHHEHIYDFTHHLIMQSSSNSIHNRS